MRYSAVSTAWLLILLLSAPASTQIVVQPEVGYTSSSTARGIMRTPAAVIVPAVAVGIERPRWFLATGAGLEVDVREVQLSSDVWNAWGELNVALWRLRVNAGYQHTSRGLPVRSGVDEQAGRELFGGLAFPVSDAVLMSMEAWHDVAEARGTYVEATASHQVAILEFHETLFGSYLQGATGMSFGGSETARRYDQSGVTHAAIALGLNVHKTALGGHAALICIARGDVMTHGGCRAELRLKYRIAGSGP